MIHNFKQFLNKIYEDYQVPTGRKFNNLSSDDLKKIAKRGLDIVDTTIPNHDIETVEVEQAPKLKTMPGFKRLVYRDANPKNVNAIVYGPLDIVFELDLDSIPVYSEFLSSIKKKESYGIGKALYYGWSADQYSDQPYFFVILAITSSDGKTSLNFTPSDPIMNKEEMYDMIWEMLDAIDDVHAGKDETLNPVYASQGRLTDKIDNFH